MTEVPSARRVNLYVARSRDCAIVAACYKNLVGIYYEQQQPIVFKEWPDHAELGRAFRAAFDAFAVQDANLRDREDSDWPSYRASRLPSIKEFERTFRLVGCVGVNASNLSVRASTPHPTISDLELAVVLNPLSAAEEVGERLMRLVDATNAA